MLKGYSQQNCWLQATITLLVFGTIKLYIVLFYLTQFDYMQKLSTKMLTMEAERQHAPGNAQVIPNQTTMVKVQYTIN